MGGAVAVKLVLITGGSSGIGKRLAMDALHDGERVIVVSESADLLAGAVAELTDAGLDAQVREVSSDKEAGTVTAQSPAAGTVVVEGTRVQINVSTGPRPISVPNVVGSPYDEAASELRTAGFGVSRTDVDSDQPAGVVVSQSPGGGASADRGTTVQLSVSTGPSTADVPDVTGQDASVARAEGKPFRSIVEADVRVTLSADALDDAFSLDRSLRNTSAVFDALDRIE